MRPPRRRWRDVALLVASLAAILAVAEGVARLLWQEDAFAPRALPPEWRELPVLEGLFAMARPNARGLVGGALYETNGAGFRGPERALAAAHPGRRFEVLNFGLAGLNAHAVVDRLVRLALRYHPDLVVYGYTLNDIEGPSYRRSVDFAWIDPRRFAAAPLALLRILGPRFDSLRELVLAPRGSYGFELDENYFRNPEALAAVLAALDRLAAVARERGICALVFVHTRLYWLSALHPYRRHYQAVSEAARARGLFAIESFPAHRGERAASLWVGPLDPHPNARGHEILLEALSAGLAQLPAECWRGGRSSLREPARPPPSP